jgi:arylsulfatase A-like enzyme
MKHIPFFLTITSLALAAVHAVTPAKPNIVFILADDLGYAETGCYGQKKIKTPHIDQLATEGMKFSQHYTGAPVCAPARCVLLTGKHLGHAEIRGNRDSGNGKKFPGQWPISAEALTIAEVLKEAGYVTGAFGKWGLGPTESTGAPNKQGFDRYYGYICQRNAHSYYPPYLDSDDKEVTINKHPIPGHMRKKTGDIIADDYRAENYAPDLILAEALKFIDKNKDRPFFLYLPFVEPHVAMQPHQKSIDQYPKSWDPKPYRGTRGYLPHPRPNAAYAAMISDLDSHVGVIMDRLKKYGLEKNTIVIFTSDNGATPNVGGVNTEFFDSMGGLRGKKGSCYEGGLRMPCIVRWPGKVKAGSQTDAATYFPDWFPTLIEIAGAKKPEASLDGVSMTSVLAGKPLPKRHEPMIWEFNGYGGIIAIREGKWKAIRRGLKQKQPQNWELYDISADRNEKNNVAKQHPEIVQRLEKSWLKTRTVNPTFPIPLVDKK